LPSGGTNPSIAPVSEWAERGYYQVAMARDETDREDLLRDATAFVERIEFDLSRGTQVLPPRIFVGFRRDGGASIYFGSDPVFHLNSSGELRRAYVDNRLLKAERGQLVTMQSVRSAGEVQLQSRALRGDEAIELLQQFARRHQELLEHLSAGRMRIVGQVPLDGNVCGRVVEWLSGMGTVSIAQSPHAC
jgi:hypothetical protein